MRYSGGGGEVRCKECRPWERQPPPRKATRAQKEAEDTGAVASSLREENGSNTFLASLSLSSFSPSPPVAVYSADIIDSRQIKNLFCPKFSFGKIY